VTSLVKALNRDRKLNRKRLNRRITGVDIKKKQKAMELDIKKAREHEEEAVRKLLREYMSDE